MVNTLRRVWRRPKVLYNGQPSCVPTLPKRTWRAERICILPLATTKARSANWKRRVSVFLTIRASSN